MRSLGRLEIFPLPGQAAFVHVLGGHCPLRRCNDGLNDRCRRAAFAGFESLKVSRRVRPAQTNERGRFREGFLLMSAPINELHAPNVAVWATLMSSIK